MDHSTINRASNTGGRIVGRIALSLLAFIALTFVTYFLLQRAAGVPGSFQGRNRPTPEAQARYRQEFALDQPLASGYGRWLGRSLMLDWGNSADDGVPVRDKILAALPGSLVLAVGATIWALIFASLLGLALAAGKNRRWTLVVSAMLFLFIAVPSFALGLLLIKAGAGYGPAHVSAYLAAIFCLGLATMSKAARYTRAAVSETMHSAPFTAARAKGIGGWRLLFGHAFKPALFPLLSLAALEIPTLLSGAVVVEVVFGLPGLGHLGYEAVLRRDVPLLLGLATCLMLFDLCVLLVGDLVLWRLDPRLGAET